ncbi:hypothetical protein PRIEUP_LOCUS683 [Pristimantis euphronides]
MCMNHQVKFFCCKGLSSETTRITSPSTHPSTSKPNTSSSTAETTSTTTLFTTITGPHPTTATQPTSSNTVTEACYWTEWVDVNHPTSDRTGGDIENHDEATAHGIPVCSHKSDIQDIKCRAISHSGVPIKNLPQKVTCNVKEGFVCKNQDNPGENMCMNHQVKFFCCKGLSSETTRITSPSTHPSTSKPNTSSSTAETTSTTTLFTTITGPHPTTATQPTSSNTVTEACYWTEWVDVNHPTSDRTGGDIENHDEATAHGIPVCSHKSDIQDIKCRAISHSGVPIKNLPQKVTCNVKEGFVCKNQDNPGENMCMNHQVKFFCCKGLSSETTRITSPSTHPSTSKPNTSSSTAETTSTTTLFTTITGPHPTTATQPTSSNTVTEACYWTEWVDVNHPTSDRTGGDIENHDEATAHGIPVCSHKSDIQDIKCRAISHSGVPIKNLPQKVTCNVKEGFVCKNQDNPGENMCMNHQVKFFCCKGLSSETTRITSPSTHPSTSKPNTSSSTAETTSTTTLFTTITGPHPTTATQPTSSNTVTEACYWTEWVDVNHPTSDRTGGDIENHDEATAHGIPVCRHKSDIQDIKCRAISHSGVPIKNLPQKVTCNVKEGFVCKNQDNPGENMCMNHQVKFFCCKGLSSETTRITSPSTHPSTSKPNTSSSTAETTSTTTLFKTITGPPVHPTTATQPTSSNTVTKACYWTEWVDVNHPTSDRTGGDIENHDEATAHGIPVCRHKSDIQDIKCRASSYSGVPIEDLPQKVTCNVKEGFICKNQDNPGEHNMCMNFEVQFFCCEGLSSETTRITSPSTHPSTSKPNTSSSTAETTSTTTLFTNITGPHPTTATQPTSSNTVTEACYWTEWVDVNHPTSDRTGGDIENHDEATAHGIPVCSHKSDIQDIKCRAISHSGVPIKNLPQKVTCNVKEGFVCKNQDNPGENMCMNHQVKFFCCKGLSSETTRITSPSTHPSTSKPNTSSSTAETTSTTTLFKTITGPPVHPTTATQPTSSNTVTKACYWTEWVDVNHPTSDRTGGDIENHDEATAHGIPVCRHKSDIQDIKCRASSYSGVPIEDLPQKVTCNVKEGFICKNQDNPGEHNMCMNFEVQFFCCEGLSSETTRITSPSTHPSTSKPNTSSSTAETTSTTTLFKNITGPHPTTATQPTSSNTVTEACYWTEWVDVNHPTSDRTGGDIENHDEATAHGIPVCRHKSDIQDIKCRAISHSGVPIKNLPQKVTCNVKEGFVCKNQDNPGENMCMNHQVKFFCCKGLSSETTRITSPSTHPSTSKPNTSSSTAETTSTTTLFKTITGPPVHPTTATQPTSSNTVTKACYWTEWVDVNHPTSDRTGGDIENHDEATAHGIPVCRHKSDIQDIKCRASSYSGVPIEDLPQKVTCNVKEGFICKNQDNPGEHNMCMNFEVQFFCCEGLSSETTRITSPSTHPSTSKPNTSSSTAETTSTTTLFKNITGPHPTTATQPTSSNTVTEACYWTEWVDVNHPTSDRTGGDIENHDEATAHGIPVCRHKSDIQDIKCRAISHSGVPIKNLPQKVTCNVKEGFVCKNQDNPGENMCMNHQVKFFCCKGLSSETTRITSPSTHPSTSKPNTSSSTAETTSTTTLFKTITGPHPTTTTQPTSSNTVTEACYWTKWVDVNHPTSDRTGGDIENHDEATAHGIPVCRHKSHIKYIKCRASSYSGVPIEDLPQKVTCNVKEGFICKNQDNPGEHNMCMNFEVQFFCCERRTVDMFPITLPSFNPSISLNTPARLETETGTTKLSETSISKSTVSNLFPCLSVCTDRMRQNGQESTRKKEEQSIENYCWGVPESLWVIFQMLWSVPGSNRILCTYSSYTPAMFLQHSAPNILLTSIIERSCQFLDRNIFDSQYKARITNLIPAVQRDHKM